MPSCLRTCDRPCDRPCGRIVTHVITPYRPCGCIITHVIVPLLLIISSTCRHYSITASMMPLSHRPCQQSIMSSTMPSCRRCCHHVINFCPHVMDLVMCRHSTTASSMPLRHRPCQRSVVSLIMPSRDVINHAIMSSTCADHVFQPYHPHVIDLVIIFHATMPYICIINDRPRARKTVAKAG